MAVFPVVRLQVVREELGKPWYEIYAELTPEPIAAASLGQVCVWAQVSGCSC